MDDFDNLGELETHEHTFNNVIRYNDANKKGPKSGLLGDCCSDPHCQVCGVECLFFFWLKWKKADQESLILMLFFFFFYKE